MLRALHNSSRWIAPLLRRRDPVSCLGSCDTRTRRQFFWGGGGKGNDDDSGSNSGSSDSGTNAVVAKAKPSGSGGGSGSSSGSTLPTTLGFGDEAPRYPHLTALPVINRPMFPGTFLTLTVSDKATLEALTEDRTGEYVGVFLRKKYSEGVTDGGVILDHPEVITDPTDLYNVGGLAQIHRITYSDMMNHDNTGRGEGVDGMNDASANDGDESILKDVQKTATLLLLGHRRIDLLSVDHLGPPIDATVSHWDRLVYKMGQDSSRDDTIRALSNEIIKTMRDLARSNPFFRENATFVPTRVNSNDPYVLADVTAGLTTASPEELQMVMEERDPEIRLQKSLELLSKDLEVSKLQEEIKRKVDEKMSESQRKYMLMEQLKSIKKELGMEKDDKEDLLARYRKKITNFQDAAPKEVMETIEAEMEKISTLEKNSQEFNVTRLYLDWLTSVPFGKVSEENLDIGDARKVLNRDHYGLDEVKDTILAYIAIGKLKGGIKGKILCLSGPPGVGKTSIAKSIADALGREFFRFSVGGLSDVSEIKGHRRTYVGAMPGKLIQCLKTTGTMNPLVLIDEIDKLAAGYRGDPSAALLELLVRKLDSHLVFSLFRLGIFNIHNNAFSPVSLKIKF